MPCSNCDFIEHGRERESGSRERGEKFSGGKKTFDMPQYVSGGAIVPHETVSVDMVCKIPLKSKE